MSLPLNTTESGLLISGQGQLKGLVINSHTSGTVKITDGTEAATAASSTLTSSGAMAPATHASATLTSTGAMVPASHAVSVFTSSGVVVDGQTITIGSIVYTAVSSLVSGSTAYSVLMGANAQAFLANLLKAINGTGDGSNYGDGTLAHPDVVAVSSDATTLTVRGRVPGTSLNTVATTETFTNGSWADTTLGGGTGASDPGVTTAGATVTIDTIVYTVVDALSETYGATAIPFQVLYGGSVAIMLDNLKLAINATGTAGTNYSTGTTAHAKVVATTNADDSQIIRARLPGTVYNTIATTETMANTAWGGTTLGGAGNTAGVTTAAAQFAINGRTYTAVIELSETLGASAVADQILWVTSEAVFLDNVKKAINASGIAGTDYSTGTNRNFDVTATTNTNTTQLIVAREAGTSGNLITTTENMANYAWTGTVLASGAGAAGKVMYNTITFSAVATTGERYIDFKNADFSKGLYIEIGGVADLTFEVNQTG